MFNNKSKIMSNQTNTEVNLEPGHSVRVNALSTANSGNGFSSTNINAYLLDLRIAVMLSISTVWKNDPCRSEYDLPEKWQERAYQILENLTKIGALNQGYSDAKDITLSEVHTCFALALGAIKRNPALSQRFAESDDAHLLRSMVELCNPENLKSLWEILFRFNPEVYRRFGVHIIKPTARWNSYGDNQWTKPDTEALYLSLPAKIPECLVPIAFDMCQYNDDQANYQYNKEIHQSDIDELKDYARAYIMTKYYESFPSFLGEATPVESKRLGGPKNFMTLEKKKNYPKRNETLIMKDLEFDSSQVDPYGNNYDLGLASDQYEGFSSMISKLLTVLWQNEEVRERIDYGMRLINETKLLEGHKNYRKLNEDGSKAECAFESLFDLSFYLNDLSRGEHADDLKDFNIEYTRELNAILNRYFHYEIPWVFNLRLIMPDEEIFFQKVPLEVIEKVREKKGDCIVEKRKTSIKDLYGYYPVKNQVLNITTIEIPHAPDRDDTDNISLALARYNATGPAYPFTCS